MTAILTICPYRIQHAEFLARFCAECDERSSALRGARQKCWSVPGFQGLEGAVPLWRVTATDRRPERLAAAKNSRSPGQQSPQVSLG